MAEEIFVEGPLKKLSWHRIQIEDASNNVLLVVLKHDSGIYRGVLLNQTANAPCGIYLPELREEKENKVNSSDLTSNVINKGQSMANTVEPSEESALSYRHTYQPELLNSSSIQVPSPIRALSHPLKNTNLRKRMLRPRHILCSKCKAVCDDDDLKTEDALVNSSMRKRKDDFEYSLVDKRHKKERKNCVPSKLGAKPMLKLMSCFPTINYGKQEALIEKNDSTDSKLSNVDIICSSQSSEYEKELNAGSESPSISLTRIDNMTTQSNAKCSSAIGQEKWNEGDLENHEKHHKHKHKHKKKHKKHKHKDVDNHDKHNHKKRHKKSKKRDIYGQSTLTSSLASSEGSSQLTQGDRVVLNTQSFDNNNLNIYSSESFQDKLNSSGEQTTSSPLLMDSDSNDTYEFPLPETMQENVATLRPLMMRIQSRDVFKCTLPDGRTVSVGDIAWGKIHGFPAWPGRVISITISQRDNGVIITQTAHVSWFGSRTRSHMPISDLHPFLEDFKIKFNKKKRGPYKNAVKQALLAGQAVSAVADVDIEG